MLLQEEPEKRLAFVNDVLNHLLKDLPTLA
jgi:hypothetical protein